MKSLNVLHRLTGRHLRDTFASEAIANVRVTLTDAEITCGYLLKTYKQGPRVIYRAAYCVNATKHQWHVSEFDSRRVTQLDHLT